MKAGLLRVVLPTTFCLVATMGFAQTPPGDDARSGGYRPGLGDLMTTTVQPRHTKLGLAGRAQNWSYAAYDQAIKAKNAARFTAAYHQLTEACDTCHQAADRAFIVIKVPDGDMFPDQDFTPAKP